MVSIVEITQASDVVTIDEDGQAVISFIINNKNINAPKQRRVGFRVNVEGEAKRAWFEIEGKKELTLDIDETAIVTVRIKVTDALAENIYKFSLLVFDVANMDEDYTQSKVIALRVPAIKEIAVQSEPKSKKWLIWLIVGVIVITSVAVIVFFMLGNDKNKEPQINPPTSAGFSAGSIAHTPLNDDGGGNSAFLDRHVLDCGNNAINQFKLHRGSETQYQYNYTCTTGGALQAPLARNTNPDLNGGGNSVYLDRHNVDCGTNSVLTKFHLLEGWNSQGQFANDKMRYDYSCAISNQPLTCRDATTPFNDEGGGNTIYLDRHDVKCASDEAISQFKLIRSGNGTFQYQYRCCK